MVMCVLRFVFTSNGNESLHSNPPTTGHFMTGREGARFVKQQYSREHLGNLF